MHRIDGAGHVAGSFSGGTPGEVEATHMTPDWANDVQENLAQFIEAAGIALVKGNYTQLRDALYALFGQLGAENDWTEPNTFSGGIVVPNGSSATFNTGPVLNAGGSVVGSTLAGSSGGSFSVDAAGEFAYNPARTEYAHIPGLMKEWVYGGDSPGAGGSNASYSANGSDAWIGNSTGGGYYVTTIRAPKGATVSGLQLLLANSHGSTAATVSVTLIGFTFLASGTGGGGFTQGYEQSVITTGSDLSVPANQTTAVWTSKTITPNLTVPDDGYLRLAVYFSNGSLLGSAGVCRLYGVRLQYSVNKVSRITG